ncbi:MAG TPA: transglycosylase SLT domain-containing protein [Gammaproteobacteria bacterium]|nr:transglycosylase SLT domain-containing protein [Gammaproteobacteria bacterium]
MTLAWRKLLLNRMVKKGLTGFFCFFCFLPGGVSFAATNNGEGIQVYQKNLHLSPERKQNLANDINRYHTADNIWDRLRRQFSLPHYENNPIVEAKIEWFLNHPDFLMHSMTRAAPYLYFILQQVKKRHLPAELVLLPIIESAYNPFALNTSSGAAGMWQMMSATASGYGIRQNGWYDGRRDVVASTKAALNHLAYLQSFFEGNWLLAIAAYDTGEGNVLAAIRRNILHGENTDFWSLPVARETRDYVPQLLALAVIISHPEQYPIEYPTVPNAPYLAEVDVGSQMDLNEAASFAGLSLRELKQLNSGYSRTATDPHGPFKIVLPIENVEQFTENLASSSFYDHAHHLTVPGYSFRHFASRSPDQKYNRKKINPIKSIKPMYDEPTPQTVDRFEEDASNTSIAEQIVTALDTPDAHYVMQPGDTLYMVRAHDTLDTIAKHFHIKSATLAIANQVTPGSALHPGQSVIIPTHRNRSGESQHYALTPGDTVYMVRPGDTIEKIAEKFHTTPAAVRLANLLSSNRLEAGDQLVIPTHV